MFIQTHLQTQIKTNQKKLAALCREFFYCLIANYFDLEDSYVIMKKLFIEISGGHDYEFYGADYQRCSVFADWCVSSNRNQM